MSKKYFLEPILAKCDNRNSMPKHHPTSGDPEDWFSNEILKSHELFSLTFDFFVNWSGINNSTITPIIWIKKILDKTYTYSDIQSTISEVMISQLGKKYLNVLNTFCQKCKLKAQFIVFRDDYNWNDSHSEIMIISFNGIDNNDQFLFTYEVINLENFKSRIQEFSGGPINIGDKGLFYGTSNLECALSKTHSLYPGDVDLIVLDKDINPIAILEFKKHNLKTSIQNQQLSNYYPKPDARKYNRLSILKDYLCGDCFNIPILNIYYPTIPNTTEGKMELLKGNTGNLKTNIGSGFSLPNSVQEYHNIVNKLKKAIIYYCSLSPNKKNP